MCQLERYSWVKHLHLWHRLCLAPLAHVKSYLRIGKYIVKPTKAQCQLLAYAPSTHLYIHAVRTQHRPVSYSACERFPLLQAVHIVRLFADSSYLCVICSKGAPAYCIVMSGGYRDDVDAGLEVQYTGEGGQSKGKHVCLCAS